MLRIFVISFLVLGLSAWGKYPPKIEEAKVETYREVGKLELKVWILGEKEENRPKPGVVFFFGGGWRFGSPDSLLNHARFLVQKGMVCVLADYRVANRHGTTIADCVADAKAALSWTRNNASRLGIDSEKIAAGGASAGGHLAACLALVDGYGRAKKPDALLLFNPALVLAPFEGQTFGYQKPIREEFAGVEPRVLSPIHHLDGELPPTWIAHGQRDRVVPIATVRAFRDEAKGGGRSCELLEVSNVGHAFHYNNPWFLHVMTGAESFLEKLGWLNESE